MLSIPPCVGPSAQRALTLAALSLAGCVAMGPGHDLGENLAAGWRPSRAYCAFGAETPALAAWCAEVNFGGEGLLAVALSVNREVLASGAGRALACTDHVAQARRRMAEYPAYRLQEIYSCAARPQMVDGHPICHVSLLASSATGAQVVLDNGHVLEPTATGGVAPYQEYAQLVDRHWTGTPPTLLAVQAPRQGANPP